MTAIEMGQLQLLSLRVMRSHAEITSGAYKFRKTERYDLDSNDYVEISDEEKLQAALATMDAHIRLANEITERAMSRLYSGV
jgi:hypothetical protein